MAQKDLIPLNQRTKEEARVIQSMGGSTKSPQKKYAAQIRAIRNRVKKGQLKTKDEEWLLERATDSNVSALALLDLLDQARTNTEDPDMIIKLTNTYNAVHKTIHGERLRTENVNINVNLNHSIIDAYQQRKKKRV